MKVTDVVLGEHCVLYGLLDHLEATVPDADEPGALRRQASLLASVLEAHARLEDELILEPLVETGGNSGGPPGAMIEEHERIRSALAEAREENDPARARDLLLHVIRTARGHFEKEERMVVPMAKRELDAERLEELGTRWLEDRGVRSF